MGRRKLARALQSPAYGCFPVIVTSQKWRQDFWILEIINYRRVKNMIVSCEAIPSEILFTIEHSNCFITTLQIAVIHSRIVATGEIKCRN